MRPGTVWTCSFLFLCMGKIYANTRPHGWCADCEIQGTEIMGFEELTCFWENLGSVCHKSNWDLVWNFFAVTLLSLSFSTNCQLICNSHFVWVSYAIAYCGNILKDFTHICQNFSLQNFWIRKVCMKIWHLILFLLWCLIVAIKFYWEKDRTFKSLGWKFLIFFFFFF